MVSNYANKILSEISQDIINQEYFQMLTSSGLCSHKQLLSVF